MSLNKQPLRQVQALGFVLLIFTELNNKCVGIYLKSSKLFGKMYKIWGDFCLPLQEKYVFRCAVFHEVLQ
jgi:hypothetical protein